MEQVIKKLTTDLIVIISHLNNQLKQALRIDHQEINLVRIGIVKQLQ